MCLAERSYLTAEEKAKARDFVHNTLQPFADQGNAISQYFMSLEAGKSIEKNPDQKDSLSAQSFDYATKSAFNKQSSGGWGQCSLGFCYLNGLGTPVDVTQGVYWTKIALKCGNPLALCNYGYLQEHGIGVLKDPTKAYQCFEKASQMGYPDSFFCMGHSYEVGGGVDKDLKKAYHNYKIAAHLGSEDAQTNLGFCYEFGKGTERDEQEAAYWYLQSNSTKSLTRAKKLNEKVVDKMRLKIEDEHREARLKNPRLRVLLVARFHPKENHPLFSPDYLPLEIFFLLLQNANLINHDKWCPYQPMKEIPLINL